MNEAAIAHLASNINGAVLQPGTPAYEEGRRGWNMMIDKHPALIVRCTAVTDVVDAVHFARDRGLGVSVRGGGHHVAGSSIIEGGLVIDLSPMRAVAVDPAKRTARAEGGAQIRDVDAATGAYGLAVPLGLFSETGIAGITLAGGLGWLRRKYGMSCDNLISAEVVTADGRQVTASATENGDLFWALRGGGWDMGVVTSFEYQAQPVGPEVFFNLTAYPLSDAKTVLRKFDEYMATAPDESAPIAIIWTFGEEPYPQEVWHKPFVGIAGTWAGSAEEGEKALQPLREFGTPMLDMSGPMPYVEVQKLFDEEYPRGRHYFWKSVYLSGLNDACIDKLIELGETRPSALTSVDVWAMGGAVARVPVGDTPISHRGAPYLIGLESNWDDPADDAKNVTWTRAAADALQPFSTGGSYLNFEDLSEVGATQRSLGANFGRLTEIKRKYDPGNLFRSRRGLVD
jgi:FAD/FMN-containing dehydrogenase